MSSEIREGAELPLVSVVFLAHNRRDELLVSVRRILTESGYDPSRLEVIVVDNASTDGTPEAVVRELPGVRLIRNPRNVGAPGWNRGFAVAGGEYVLILDDDAYLGSGGLERAVVAARRERADLVSFSVVSSCDNAHRLNDDWQTGLLSYWGCAALISAAALRTLNGYDPNIFIWANEVELTMRLLDHGLRHLYLPDVYAVHMKERVVEFDIRRYLVNARHHGYIAGKLMRPADALAAVANILQRAAIDSLAHDSAAIVAVKEVIVGFVGGLRRRQPVRPVVSAAYRRNFHPFAGPWHFMRSPLARLRSRGNSAAIADQRRERQTSYYAERATFYPSARGSLQL